MRSIAFPIKLNASTIFREFRRFGNNYSPTKAQENYRERRRKCHKPHFFKPAG